MLPYRTMHFTLITLALLTFTGLSFLHLVPELRSATKSPVL